MFILFILQVIEIEPYSSLPFHQEGEEVSAGMPGNQRIGIIRTIGQPETSPVNPFDFSSFGILDKNLINSILIL